MIRSLNIQNGMLFCLLSLILRIDNITGVAVVLDEVWVLLDLHSTEIFLVVPVHRGVNCSAFLKGSQDQSS